MICETKRLILRNFEQSDAKDVEKFWGDEDVMEHSGGAVPHEFIPKVLASYLKCQTDKGISVYAVEEKESGRVIGAAGFNVRTSSEKVELVYHFAKDAWGKGYATEAARACIDFAKAKGNVGTIYASADLKNPGSLKILEKVGFDYKGMKWFEDTNQEEPYYEMVLKNI